MAKLTIGDQAPHFEGRTWDGRHVSLADYVGRRAVVVFFYPRDHTRVCTKEACAFRDAYELFAAAGADVIGISGDSADSHREFARQHQLSFPLLSDADGKIRMAFGVSKTLGLIPVRVTFVIDKAGVIRLIFSALLLSHEHVEQALVAVRQSA